MNLLNPFRLPRLSGHDLLTSVPPAPANPIPAYLALGSNLGDRHAHLRFALGALAALPGTTLLGVSGILETDPVGPVPQGKYLNAAAAIETRLGPHDLLARLHGIERAAGRDRATGERWGPRTLDLDLLLYAGVILNGPGLTVPHPRLHERLFVLEPLSQIAPSLIVPGLGRSISDLRDALLSPPPPTGSRIR